LSRRSRRYLRQLPDRDGKGEHPHRYSVHGSHLLGRCHGRLQATSPMRSRPSLFLPRDHDSRQALAGVSIRRICERCLAEDPLRPVTSPRANLTAASGCHPAWWQPGRDSEAGAQPARGRVPPAAGSCGESPRRVRRPIPPQRRRSVPIASKDRLGVTDAFSHTPSRSPRSLPGVCRAASALSRKAGVAPLGSDTAAGAAASSRPPDGREQVWGNPRPPRTQRAGGGSL
jgi:hypothetical protein